MPKGDKMSKPKEEFRIWHGNPQISGLYWLGNTYNFTLEAQEDDEVCLLLYRKGIVCGRGNNVFFPASGITRAEFAQILYKARLNVQITYSGIGQ